MTRRQTPRTDYGTIIVHWLVVLALTVSLVTGLRIAADTPQTAWLNVLWPILPQGDIWTVHMQSGLALCALAFAYAVYIARAGLSRRVKLDRARLSSVARQGRPRWAAVNVVLYWGLFAVLLAQIVTGMFLYLGHGGRILQIHLWCAAILAAYPIAHVAAHWGYGGMDQIMRVFRPARLRPRVAQPNLADTLAEHFNQDAEMHRTGSPAPDRGRGQSSRQTATPPRHRPTTLHVHPLTVAFAAGLSIATFATAIDKSARDKLVVRSIAKSEAPKLDGDLAEPVWRNAPEIVIPTSHGANLDGGTSEVRVKALHDGEFAYLAFTWDDPTRSLKHLPMIKRADGWHLLNKAYDIEDENDYYEDKFSVMFALSNADAGGGTAHLGNAPLAGKPPAFSGRGLHYTTDGSIVDVWHWKAARGGLLGYMDDNYFGPPSEPTKSELEGKSRYKAGYSADPGKAPYSTNFEQQPPGGYAKPLVPRRLPKNVAATNAAMGHLDIDPNHGEPEGARWWMTSDETVPYKADLDTQIPIGTIMPSVLIAGDYTADRADVKCAARWSAGRWTLEVSRRLNTGSKFDIPIATGVSMWVAAFDHSQTRHTRHLRPIKLEVE